MGWTGIHATHYKKNGDVDRKAECDSYWLDGLSAGHFEVVKSTMVGTTYYAAIKPLVKRNGVDEIGHDKYEPLPESEQDVFAVVFLTNVDKKDYFNFNYKNMDETMCPYSFDCPVGILDLLSPTDNELANEWREKCRQSAKDKAAKKQFIKLLKDIEVGQRIKFILKQNMSDGSKSGSEVCLIKTIHQGKPIWYGGGYKWSDSLIADASGMDIAVCQLG